MPRKSPKNFSVGVVAILAATVASSNRLPPTMFTSSTDERPAGMDVQPHVASASATNEARVKERSAGDTVSPILVS